LVGARKLIFFNFKIIGYIKKTEFQVLNIERLHVLQCLSLNLGILCVCELWGGLPGDPCMILSVDKS